MFIVICTIMKHVSLYSEILPLLSTQCQQCKKKYILFGYVTLLCGTFLFIFLSVGPVNLSHCEHHQIGEWISRTHSGLSAYPFKQVWFTPHGSETFTQRRMQGIGAGSLHSEGRVNGATVGDLFKAHLTSMATTAFCSIMASHLVCA